MASAKSFIILAESSASEAVPVTIKEAPALTFSTAISGSDIPPPQLLEYHNF